MGIPGAGKSRVAEAYAARDHLRLNRDERGGTLRALADELEDGARVRRAAGRPRQHVPRRARRGATCRGGGAPRHSRAMRVARHAARAGAGQHGRSAPRSFRLAPDARGVESGGTERAWSDGADVPDARAPRARTPRTRRGLRVHRAPTVLARAARGAGRRVRRGVRAAGGGPARRDRGRDPTAPHLVFDWLPDGSPDDLADASELLPRAVSGPIEPAVCPHGGGPPICWCRPPLPGLLLAFARAYGVDPERSTLVGTSPAHRTLAATLDARFVEVN